MTDVDELKEFGLANTRPDLVAAELDGERLVLDLDTGDLHHFDGVAALIWSFLDGTATSSELASDLAAGFGVDRDVVASQLSRLLRRLEAGGLLEDTERAPRLAAPGDGGYGYLVDPPSP